MKKKKLIFIILVLLVLVIIGICFFLRDNLRDFLDSWNYKPTHKPLEESCPWKKDSFKKAGITAFIENCTDERAYDPENGYAMVFSDTDKKIIGKWVTNSNFEFIIQVFTKDKSRNPLDVVKEWYAKLTPEQQKVCEIQDADEPLRYFKDGRLMVTEDPHPTKHKTRYKIDVKNDIAEQIFQNTFPGDTEYDYLCGHVVGTTQSGHPPYFEFDDRSPEKYLFVGTYGMEGPTIDLNSIRF